MPNVGRIELMIMPTIKYNEGQELSQSPKNVINYAKRILRAAKESCAKGYDEIIKEFIIEFGPQQQLQPPVAAVPLANQN